MRKITTTFLLLLLSYFSFAQPHVIVAADTTTRIPTPSQIIRIKEFKFENNNAEGFVKVIPLQDLQDRWHRRRISQVRTLNTLDVDEGTIVASSSSINRKLFVIRSPTIDIPIIANGMEQNNTLYVLSVNHEATFNVLEAMGDFPAKITLHFLESGYKYDYYVNTDGLGGVKIPFFLKKDNYSWHGTQMRIELSFLTKPNTYWMIKDISLLKYSYDIVMPYVINNFIPLGVRTGSSGTGTSGPTGPRN